MTKPIERGQLSKAGPRPLERMVRRRLLVEMIPTSDGRFVARCGEVLGFGKTKAEATSDCRRAAKLLERAIMWQNKPPYVTKGVKLCIQPPNEKLTQNAPR
jgi:hypothetical protein